MLIFRTRRLPRLPIATRVARPPALVPVNSVAARTARPYSCDSERRRYGHRSGIWASVEASTVWPTRKPPTPLLVTTRHFHATPRRDALPLLPALGAFLKGTSLLTVTTGVSRLLISFFPIGTLATFRLARGVSWLSKDKRVPKMSPEAEEFWKMWCEDEKGVRITPDEAEALVDAPETEHEGLVGPDGRVAFPVPMPRDWRKRWTEKEGSRPSKDEDGGVAYDKWARRMARRIRHSYFFLPSLPPVSVRFYNELSTAEQAEVSAMRRYWISLRFFKDRLAVARWAVALLIVLPIIMLLSVWAAGLERVPLTGRWRLILLTAEEEDIISDSLQGANWYKSVINMLTTPDAPAPPIVPLSDWRWGWVQSTLRKLERGVVRAVERLDHGDPERPSDATGPWPPPPQYPLRPRPRVSARLHAALPRGEHDAQKEHLQLGPPYNVMLMEAPDKNAFSYGFGGQGAGGIVIFTGLLDDILSRDGPAKDDTKPPPQRSFWDRLFSASPPQPRSPPHPEPTEAQTLHLAIVLAHEMGHLLLSHHLETLSHQQVLWPSILGLSIDTLRAFIWPFTIFLGPAVNDALANLGRTTAQEMTESYGHVGFERVHEFEADYSALRLLSNASWNPREAVDDFASSLASLEEIRGEPGGLEGFIKLWSWDSHPSSGERVDAMRTELDRWETYDARIATEKP